MKINDKVCVCRNLIHGVIINDGEYNSKKVLRVLYLGLDSNANSEVFYEEELILLQSDYMDIKDIKSYKG